MVRLCSVLLVVIAALRVDCLSLSGYRSPTNDQHLLRPVRTFGDVVPDSYLLFSTASKIYCMKMSMLESQMDAFDVSLAPRSSYDIIYEEDVNGNCWITDVFYVRSEDLIYVNVYNSSASSSQIMTLKNIAGEWQKTILFRDQPYCLGITYNEEARELYWTSSKSIHAGSSQHPGDYRVLFNLLGAKKLLYIKYDPVAESIYVSTLNYVYACALNAEDRHDCRIVARDLLSARGLFLDNVNRWLYVVDHKRRQVTRVRLRNTSETLEEEVFDADANALTTQHVLSTQTTADLGDIFYMTIYDTRNTNLMLWSEFSGKIKAAPLNDTHHYRVNTKTSFFKFFDRV